MWPFSSVRLARDAEVHDALHRHHLALLKLQERMDAAEAAAERLRGRVYGNAAHRAPEALSKAEVLRQHFTPGKPVNHT